ncbi:hypothetical protein CY34DRAFT_773561 [Suillus luteus UH-Slu-Lm8-n1]|uniref:Uncharacterized protein n=1 Tax=Suillus luteus UH-Slu-Lm8-n1 TaxID=930992 RepID=A0A0C9ZKR6_9AGAM|nr:hypothetical protein CY34DRAFT_773561 [Suillus luteus UH-Slu-Lm8-n1]
MNYIVALTKTLDVRPNKSLSLECYPTFEWGGRRGRRRRWGAGGHWSFGTLQEKGWTGCRCGRAD